VPGTLVRFVDGHNDVLLALRTEGEGAAPFLEGRPLGHLDLERAKRGGFAVGFFAIFVRPEGETEPPKPPREPPYARPLDDPVDPAYARREAGEMVELLFALETASDGAIVVVRAADELERCVAGETLGAILHLEGADPIDAELEALEGFYDRGLRSVGLVWSRPNVFAHGVPFEFPNSPDIGPGLTDAGRRLVRECNRQGILLDLSHLNERGFWDVAELSHAPLVASHSNAHALCASTRNLTDAQLDEIGRSGGIVGITVHAGMLREDGRLDPATPLERVLDHVDYAVDRIGIDHVGFGSDFDGAIVIDEIPDAAGLPKLAECLRGRGYGEPELAKLAHENWLRVVRETWS
jgi:membrane dipeptidase